jgi:hypothetical protein
VYEYDHTRIPVRVYRSSNTLDTQKRRATAEGRGTNAPQYPKSWHNEVIDLTLDDTDMAGKPEAETTTAQPSGPNEELSVPTHRQESTPGDDNSTVQRKARAEKQSWTCGIGTGRAVNESGSSHEPPPVLRETSKPDNPHFLGSSFTPKGPDKLESQLLT